MAADLDVNAEIIRVRERLHELANTVQTASGAVSFLEKSVGDWQKAHDLLDNVRNNNLHEKLSELKGMLETIPVKLGVDLAVEKARTDLLERAYWQMRGIGTLGGIVLIALSIWNFVRALAGGSK